MNIHIQIFEVFPSIYEVMENEDDNIILIFIIKGVQHVFNMIDVIEDKIIISLKLKEIKSLINYEIFRNENLICEGDFFPFNETKWINSKNLKNPKLEFHNSFDFMRIKMKCTIINDNLIMKNNIKKNSKLIKKTGLSINNKSISKQQTITNKKSFNNNSTFEKIKENNMTKKNNIKLKHNKSCEDTANHSKIIYSSTNQFSMDDSMNNPLSNSVSGRNYTIRKSNESKETRENLNNIKRLNSQRVKTRKQHNSYNLSMKSNSSGNYKTSASSIRDNSKDILRMNHNNNNFNLFNFNSFHFNENKLDDNFKSIDEAIIDKEFENGIENDEIICFTKKTNKKYLDNDCSVDSVSSFNKNSNENDDEITNFNFENLKNDFDIFYTNEYLNNIDIEVIELEVQLLIEKIFEIQEAYHLELMFLRKKNISMDNTNNLFFEKLNVLNKKISKLNLLIDRKNLRKNKNSFVQENKIKNVLDIIQANKEECNIWNNIFNRNEKKKYLLNIFNKLVLQKFNIRKKHLNNIQRLVCEKLINKYNIHHSNQIFRKENLINNNIISPNNPIKSSKHFKSKSISYPPKPISPNQNIKLIKSKQKNIRGFKTKVLMKKAN